MLCTFPRTISCIRSSFGCILIMEQFCSGILDRSLSFLLIQNICKILGTIRLASLARFFFG